MSMLLANQAVTNQVLLPRLGRALWAWIALNVLDAVLTYYLIGIGGVEGNPMLGLLQGHVGVMGMLAAKVLLAAAVGLVVAARRSRTVLRSASVLMALVVVYNSVLTLYATFPAIGLPFIN